jgi:hypothetical protein
MESIQINGVTFRVGDKVKVLRRFDSNDVGWVSPKMDEAIGKVGTIVTIWPGITDRVYVKVQGSGTYSYLLEVLDNLTDKERKAKAAQKAKHEAEKQAKSGINGPVKFRNFMRVVTRDKGVYIVVPKGDEFQAASTPLIFVDAQGSWMTALKSQRPEHAISHTAARFYAQFDVVEIYAAPGNGPEMLDFTKKGKLLWSEEQQKLQEEQAEVERQQKLVKIAALKAEIAQLEKEL